MEGEENDCETINQLSKIANGWTRDALSIDSQTCTEAETSVALPGWKLGIESAGRDVL